MRHASFALTGLTKRLAAPARWAAVAALAGAAAACGIVSSGDDTIAGESILRVTIPGTSGGETTTASDGTVTKLFDVAGDWSLVSIEIAEIVQRYGWTITALNCVGTGNDVIAEKQVGDDWLLLESGAGSRGAGVIVSRNTSRRPSSGLTVTGRCPPALVEAVDTAH